MDKATSISVFEFGDESEKEIIDELIAYVIKAVFNAILTPVFCLLGSITNVINIIVFYRMGFSETINISLVGLAISDFGSCFTLIFWSISIAPWFWQYENIPFIPQEIAYVAVGHAHVQFAGVTKLLTAFISFERCLCVTMPLKVKSIITKKRVKIYCICCYISLAVTYIPLYYSNRLAWKFSPQRNKTIFGLVYRKSRPQITAIVYPFSNVAFSLIPFLAITVSTIFLVLSLQKNSKWRQETMSTVSKTSNKERKVSKMVVIICVLFIICFFPYACFSVLLAVNKEVKFNGKYENLGLTVVAIVYFCECVNSACNIFIYYSNSSVYKTTFNQLFSQRKKTVQGQGQ